MVTTLIEIERKHNWRQTQRAHSKGLIYDVISGRFIKKPPGWWPKKRYKVRQQLATYFSTHPGGLFGTRDTEADQTGTSE